jgi:hypothetical protein
MRIVLNLTRTQLHELNLLLATGWVQQTYPKDEAPDAQFAFAEWQRAYVAAMRKS